MSILVQLERKATGQRRPNSMWGAPLSITQERTETGKIEPMGFGTSLEYELSLTLVSRFWANGAQLETAQRIAERSLATLLYHDVLAKLSEIEHAVIDGEGRAAYAACSELRTMLTRS